MKHLHTFENFLNEANKYKPKDILKIVDGVEGGSSAEEYANTIAQKTKSQDKYEDILDLFLDLDNEPDEMRIMANIAKLVNN